jgi:hypothetical protein
VAGHSKEPVDTVTGGAITLRVYKYILWLYSELDLFSFLCASSSFDCLNVSSNYCVLCVHAVRAFDTHTMTWTILDVHGKTPVRFPLLCSLP